MSLTVSTEKAGKPLAVMSVFKIHKVLFFFLFQQKKLRSYDFDFSHWPLDFSWAEVSNP